VSQNSKCFSLEDWFHTWAFVNYFLAKLTFYSGVFRLPSDDVLNEDSQTHAGVLAFAVSYCVILCEPTLTCKANYSRSNPLELSVHQSICAS
jgi:hypothetical protein